MRPRSPEMVRASRRASAGLIAGAALVGATLMGAGLGPSECAAAAAAADSVVIVHERAPATPSGSTASPSPASSKDAESGAAAGSAKSGAPAASAGAKKAVARPAAKPEAAVTTGAPARPATPAPPAKGVVRATQQPPARLATTRPAATAVPTRAASRVTAGAPAPQDERVIYHYNALGRRDPFQPLVGGGFVGADVGGTAPPDIGGIEVVGIVWGSEDKFALVEDGRGNSMVLRQGDKVMNGYVESLKRDAVIVKLSVDGQTHVVSIPLTRKGEKNESR